jgi:hypothetical protein
MSTVNGGQGNIIKEGLTLWLDAANPRSYPPPYNGTTWTDVSGTINSGSLINGPTFTTGSSGGIRCDGSNDYIRSYVSNLTTGQKEGSLTYEYWLRPNSIIYGSFVQSTTGVAYFTPGTAQGLGGDASYNYGNASYTGFQFCLGTNGFVAGLHNDSFAPPLLVDYQSYTGINHLVVIKNTYNVQYYINGVLKKTSSTIARIIGDSMSRITSSESTYFGRYFNGTIHTVRFYSKALSQQEVSQNFNATRARFGI